ncbi:MAG: arylsulfatase A-like enzyme [Pseudohongiellaceae bacterium]|jgi:arylsulfatase A-like enzyme
MLTALRRLSRGLNRQSANALSQFPVLALMPSLVMAMALASSSCAPESTTAPRQLVLLISVDTLRADHVGAFGGPADLTPRIDRLASESTIFSNTWSPAPFTLPSVSTLLSGRYPEENGVVRNDCALPNDVPTLATLFAEAGFATSAVVSNFVLRDVSGLARGFNAYDDTFTRVEANRNVPERDASQTTDAALAWLDSPAAQSGPLFLWTHYQDPHGPYTPTAEQRARFFERERSRPDGERQLSIDKQQFGLGAIPAYQVLENRRDIAFYRAGYAGEVAALDEQLGELFDGLAEQGLYDNALIVFTADHGESLGEGDYWFAHGEFLSQSLLNVPLIIRRPGQQTASRNDVSGLHDLLPTIAAHCDLPTPPGLSGRDLFADGGASRGSAVYLSTLSGATVRRVGLVKGEHRLVLSKPGDNWEPQLWDLAREASVEDDQLIRRWGRELTGLFATLPLRPPNWQSQMSDADLADLRALGYLGGDEGQSSQSVHPGELPQIAAPSHSQGAENTPSSEKEP